MPKKIVVDAWVEVVEHQPFWQSYLSQPVLEAAQALAKEVNAVFKNHRDLGDLEAIVRWKEAEVCSKCEKPLELEPATSEDGLGLTDICACCGEVA